MPWVRLALGWLVVVATQMACAREDQDPSGPAAFPSAGHESHSHAAADPRPPGMVVPDNLLRPPEAADPIVVSVRADGNDGTEVDGAAWYESGLGHGVNRMGHKGSRIYRLGLRFLVPNLRPGLKVAYARLVLPALSYGEVSSGADLRIVGLAADSVPSFPALRPASHPRTAAAVAWRIDANWTGRLKRDASKCVPFRRYSPDISAIINEVLARPSFGSGAAAPSVALVIEPASVNDAKNYLAVEDSIGNLYGCRGIHAAKLELYPTVRSAFTGKELLGRPTDSSITINVHALVPVEIYFLYGTERGRYDHTTAATIHPANAEIEQTLRGLVPNTRYFYRMMYRRVGDRSYEAGPERSFHTQRARNTSFVFALQSDSHLQGMLRANQHRSLVRYRQTLANVLAATPDFFIDLGDTFHSQYFAGRDAIDFDEAVHRHLDHRPYFDGVGHSVPLFLVVGNHEGEQGWRLDGTADNLAVWATRARKLLYPNPFPNGFYTGIGLEHPFVGTRESVYAWEWGDALFVVLDPIWYTQTNPHPRRRNLGVGDGWAWTLGNEQYAWLRRTLERSQARFKFVLAHHSTGSVSDRKPYARGGVRAATQGGTWGGSYEWGGYSADGSYELPTKRPGWPLPVHDLLVANDVAVFFHGHDHCFAHETLDNVVYLEVPSPSDNTGSRGQCVRARAYDAIDVFRNSGFVRVLVRPTRVTIEYVRTYLEGEGKNAEVAFSTTLYDCNRNGVVDQKDIARDIDLDLNGDGLIDACEPPDAVADENGRISVRE